MDLINIRKALNRILNYNFGILLGCSGYQQMLISLLLVQVVNAEKFGAAGLILFSDPHDLPTYGSQHNGIPYPRGSFLPKTAAQRGSILKDFGDPLTPGYPAKGKKQSGFY